MKIILILSVLLLFPAISVPAQKSVNERSRGGYVRAGGIRIHYLEWNARGKSTVVLLHGLFDTSDTWKKLAPLLARDHRVIALDRRGSGLTTKPAGGYDFPTLANDVSAFIDAMKLGKVHLVGHSAGGGVALTIAATAPEKIASVTLIDGGFWPKRAVSELAQPKSPCKARRSVCLRAEAIESSSMAHDPEPLYAKVSAPALFIMGYPPKAQAAHFEREIREAHSSVENAAKSKLRNGKFLVISDAGHWIQTDQPNKLAEELTAFFKGSRREPPDNWE